MSRNVKVVLSSLLMLAVVTSAAMAQAPATRATFKLPDYKRVQMPNGLTLLLMEKRQIPVLSVVALVKSGATADAPGKEGTAMITADLLRRGTQTKSAAQFASDVDFIGMNLQTAAQLEYSTVTARWLAKDADKGLALIADMLLHPAFPDAEVKRQVAQSADQVRSDKDDPSNVLDRYFAAYMFKGHPYGRPVTGDERSLPQITRSDLVAFHERNYTPANTVVAVVGDFSAPEIERKLRALFDGWKGIAPKLVAAPVLKPVSGRRILLIDKPDATQTYFAVGNIGMARTNPDRASSDLVNTLFGGRFTSMINSELRIKSGLTYGAGSQFERHRAPGPFFISTFTKNATTGETLDKTFEVLGRLHGQAFTAEQLSSGKAYISGRMPPRVETTPQLANAIAELEFYGLPRTDFDTYLTNVEATSGADAAKIIQTYFPKADDLTMVVIGKASEIEPVIRKYGTKVETRKIDDPGF
jgi:predicted Zn-dependent peptidase